MTTTPCRHPSSPCCLHGTDVRRAKHAADVRLAVQERVDVTVWSWQPLDGDGRCMACGRLNPLWFAPADLWNLVVAYLGVGDAVLCPTCFAALAERMHGPHDVVRIEVVSTAPEATS